MGSANMNVEKSKEYSSMSRENPNSERGASRQSSHERRKEHPILDQGELRTSYHETRRNSLTKQSDMEQSINATSTNLANSSVRVMRRQDYSNESIKRKDTSSSCRSPTKKEVEGTTSTCITSHILNTSLDIKGGRSVVNKKFDPGTKIQKVAKTSNDLKLNHILSQKNSSEVCSNLNNDGQDSKKSHLTNTQLRVNSIGLKTSNTAPVLKRNIDSKNTELKKILTKNIDAALLSNKSPDNSLVVIVGTTSDGNNIKKSNSKEVCKVERKFVREKEVTSENTSFNDNSKTLEKEREVVKSNDTVISPHKTSNNEPHCKSTNDSLVIVVGTNSDERIIKKSNSKMKNSSENILANDDSNKMSNKEFKYKPHENSVIAMVRTDSGKHNSNKSSLNSVYITEEKSVENAVNVMVETDSCESSVNKSNSKKKCIAYENFDGEKEATSENIPICDISKSTNEKAMAKTIDKVLLSDKTSSNKTRDNSIENTIDVMIKNGSDERYIRETNAKKANIEEEKSTSEKDVTSACNLANDDSKKVNKEKKNAKGSVSDLWFNKTFDNEPALKPLDNSIDVVGRTDSSENNIKKSNSQNIGVKKNKST